MLRWGLLLLVQSSAIWVWVEQWKQWNLHMIKLFWAAWWWAKRLSLEPSMLDERAILVARRMSILKGSLNYSYTGSVLAEPTHEMHLLVSVQNSMEQGKFDQCEQMAKPCQDKQNGKQNTGHPGALELLVLFWNAIACISKRLSDSIGRNNPRTL